MIYVHFACYALLVYLLWKSDKKADLLSKLNQALVLQVDANNNKFDELLYQNDLLRSEAKFVVEQHDEINKNYNLQREINISLQGKLALLDDSYANRIKEFQTQIENLTTTHQTQIEKEKKKARQDALKRSRSVMRGQATEHLAPYMMDNINPKDCRFMGNPVDYIVFDGLSAVTDKTAKEINQIKFIDIKTGKSNLNTAQRRIRDAIKEGKVSFEIVNPDKKEKENDVVQTI